jgi:hypothetical protein
MLLPLTLQDVSMLLAVSAVLLLLTAEFASYASGGKMSMLDMKKLRNLAIALGALFLVSIAITIINMILALQPS